MRERVTAVMRRFCHSRSSYIGGVGALLLSGVLAVGIAACGGSSSTSPSSAGTGTTPPPGNGASASGTSTNGASGIALTGGTGPKVKPTAKHSLSSINVALFYDPTTNAYVEAYKKTAAAVANQLGIHLTQFGSDDENTQLDQIQTAQASGRYNAWIVAAYDPTQECNLILGIAKRAPTLILNQGLCGHNTYTAGTVSFVGSQTKQVFSQYFGYIASHNPSGGEVALLTGPALNYNTDNAEFEFKAMLKAHSTFSVVANEQLDYSEAQAYTATTDLLQSHPNIKILISDYSDMTVGAARAIGQLGLTGKVKLYDLGASSQAIQDLKAGQITMSYPLLPVNEVGTAIKAMVAYWTGQAVNQYYDPDSQLNFSGAPFVTKANVADFKPTY
jgi:ribose transport system substrate-binding protein